MRQDNNWYGECKDRIELLKKLILNGSPISMAIALTILDKETKGRISKELKRILKDFKSENLLVAFPNLINSSRIFL